MNNKLQTVSTKENKATTIESREIALMMEKEHKEVLQYIEGRKDKNGKDLIVGILPTLTSEGLHPLDFFIKSSYKDTKGEDRKCYLVTKMGCELLGNKQQGAKGILFSAKYVKKFNDMEKQLQETQFKLPKTYKEALQYLIIAEEEKEQLQLEVVHHKDVIKGLVDDIPLAEKRQLLNRVVRKVANYQDRWREIYRQYEMLKHVNVKKRFESYNETHSPKMKSKLDYIDKVMNGVPELYDIACKLYHNDVENLVREMYALQEAK